MVLASAEEDPEIWLVKLAKFLVGKVKLEEDESIMENNG